MHATGTIQHNGWDENPYHTQGDLKLNKTDANCVLEGEFAASGKWVMLMTYADEKTCHYSGYMMLEGTLGGRSGSLAIYEQGIWSEDTARSTWTIVERSGRGELAGITGSGSYAARHDKTVHYGLDYELPAQD